MDTAPPTWNYVRVFSPVGHLALSCRLLFSPVLASCFGARSSFSPRVLYPFLSHHIWYLAPLVSLRWCLGFLFCLTPALCLQIDWFPLPEKKPHAPRPSPTEVNAQSSITTKFLERTNLSYWFTSSLSLQCSGLPTPLTPFVVQRVSVCDTYF